MGERGGMGGDASSAGVALGMKGEGSFCWETKRTARRML